MKRIAIVGTATVLAGLIATSTLAYGEVLFQDNFNKQPDWTSEMYSTNPTRNVSAGDKLPQGFTAMYTKDQWGPENGYPNKHPSMEILASNADKCIGHTGKCIVKWRESYSLGWKNWASDTQLVKYFGKQYNQLYIRFYINFGPNFYGRDHTGPWQSKLFRVGSWNGTGDIFNGARGGIGPVFFWDYKHDTYGVRNMLTFRGGPWGQNYVYNGQYPSYLSLDYGKETAGQAPGGTNPQLTDQVNGGYLVNKPTPLSHDQVFGKTGHWTKVAFFVKMNSAPGVADGEITEWINGARIVHKTNVPWILNNTDNKIVGWNYFSLTGNDYLQPYPNSDEFEDWYAIDDVYVSTTIPESASSSNFPPSAPKSLNVNY